MSPSVSRPPLAVALGVALLATLIVPAVASADVVGTTTDVGAPVVRINSGGGAVTDAGGRVWRADSYFTGGSTWDSGRKVESATPEVDRNERVGDSRYSIPVPTRGDYVVRLHLTELYWNRVGQRTFDIAAEGSVVATGLDILATHRKYQTKLVDARRTVNDGFLNVDLKTVKTGASITAIEVFHAASVVVPVTSPSPNPASGSTSALPEAMQGVVATSAAGSTSLVLSDKLPVPNGSPAVTGIRRTRNDPTGAHGGPWSAVDLPGTTSRTFLGLLPGVEYELTTAAVNANGTGPATTVKATVGASGSVSITPVTSPTPASTSALPEAMQGVVATSAAGTTSLVLSDKLPVPNGSPAVTGIRRTRNDPTGAHGGPWSAVDAPGTTSRTFLGLLPGVEYELTTAAVNANGTGPATTVKATVGASGSVLIAPISSPIPAPTPAPEVLTGAPTTSSQGSFVERAYTRTYALTGLQVGTSGDSVANGNRMRSVLAAAQPGDLITVAPGHYRLAGNIEFTVPNVTLKGLGTDREQVWFEHTTETRAIFMVKAGGVHFYNFTHRVPASTRSSLGQYGEGNIWVQGGHSGFRMQDVLAWGSRDAAIFLYGVHNFELNRVESRDSKSDCYHVSNGSSYGTWYDSKSTRCGDDGIGFVGYGGEGTGTPHHHTVVRHHVAGQSWGRGFGIIHVNNISFHGPTLIEDSAGASVILARESQYGSGAVRAIQFFGELRIRRANSHTGIGHGAIVINNPDTTAPIEDVLFTGPVLISDTRTTAPTQIRVSGTGRIQAEIRDVRFHGTGPTTRLSTSLTAGSTLTTPGWTAATPYSGAEPAFPLG